MPKLESVSINYSVGVKANIGNYESSDAHFSRSETWTVEDLAEADSLYQERYTALASELDELAMQAYTDMKGA